MLTRTVIAAIFLTLGACASSPDYVEADGAYDYGYSSRKIAENRYRVNFNGRNRADVQETRDYALLRAAELTLAEGYDWFEVVDRETMTTESRDRRAPGAEFGYEETWYVEQDCGLLSCRRSVRPARYQTTRIGFDTTRPAERHAHSIEIVMGKGDEPEDGHAYNARDVMKTIYEQA